MVHIDSEAFVLKKLLPVETARPPVSNLLDHNKLYTGIMFKKLREKIMKNLPRDNVSHR
jgi:hypothetical protein